MIFITGPLFSGKKTFAKALFGWSDEELLANAVLDAQELVRNEDRLAALADESMQNEDRLAALADESMQNEDHLAALADESMQNEDRLAALADELAARPVVIATEVGGGVVPSDPKERKARERAGRLACLLASRADSVFRLCCGIPELLKGELS